MILQLNLKAVLEKIGGPLQTFNHLLQQPTHDVHAQISQDCVKLDTLKTASVLDYNGFEPPSTGSEIFNCDGELFSMSGRPTLRQPVRRDNPPCPQAARRVHVINTRPSVT